jgi:2-oxo-4-hydroxy-4-carboxy-5-ureidoimidazoline decarboxylase
MRLDELNALGSDDAVRELLRCCGSRRWAREMVSARPFVNVHELGERSDAVWASLDPSDRLEAFAAHPRIGASSADKSGSTAQTTARWSEEEQAGVTESSRGRLERLNREYEARFGYIFIICATGKSGDEMLHALERRMRNNPDDELREAAEEQRKIARLRLAKLLQ